MRPKSARAAVLIGFLLTTALLASGQSARKIYAQKLVEEVAAKHPDIVIFAMHVTAPGQDANTIVASNFTKIIGKKSDADDLRAIDSPRPLTEVSKDAKRFEVLLPLKDRSGKNIGALATVFHYKTGEDQSKLVERAIGLRNQIQPRIPSLAALFRKTGS